MCLLAMFPNARWTLKIQWSSYRAYGQTRQNKICHTGFCKPNSVFWGGLCINSLEETGYFYYSHRFAFEAARTDRNLCSRSRESVVWGSGRECEEARARFHGHVAFSRLQLLELTLFRPLRGQEPFFHVQMHTCSRPYRLFHGQRNFHCHTVISCPKGHLTFDLVFGDQMAPQDWSAATCALGAGKVLIAGGV